MKMIFDELILDQFLGFPVPLCTVIKILLRFLKMLHGIEHTKHFLVRLCLTFSTLAVIVVTQP